MKVTPGRIVFSKGLNELDRLALDFSAILRRHRVRHVFVAGYIAILFGRARVSEDVDVLIEDLPFGRFQTIWPAIRRRFECHQTHRVQDAYDDYLDDDLALRFSRRRRHIPNVEVRLSRHPLHRLALEGAVVVIVNRRKLAISPLELQIAYKLHLGTDKDVLDARYLYRLFEPYLRPREMRKALDAVHVPTATATLLLEPEE